MSTSTWLLRAGGFAIIDLKEKAVHKFLGNPEVALILVPKSFGHQRITHMMHLQQQQSSSCSQILRVCVRSTSTEIVSTTANATLRYGNLASMWRGVNSVSH